MRSKRAYEIVPGDEVADFPGGIVNEVQFMGNDSELVKIIFDNNVSMRCWDDELIRVYTDAD
jgi:hypothetical protein